MRLVRTKLGLDIDNIAITVMLQHEAAAVIPVVEDLASRPMAADAPLRLVTFLHEVVVAGMLDVKVLDFEGGVVDGSFEAEFGDEEGVMVGVV